MIIYRVEITLDPGIESDWLDWMKSIHVPDVLRTGCFTECRICKVLESELPGPVYVMQYKCESIENYRRYREQFATALQKDHSNRFAGRFRGARQILEEIGAIRVSDK